MRDDLEIPPPGYRVGRRSAVIDPATRRLAVIAAGIGGALVVLVGMWSMIGGGAHTIPVVAPPPGPMRVKPAHPGGMRVAGTTDPILGSGTSGSGSAALAPPPETPDLQALRAPHSSAPAARAPAAHSAMSAPAPAVATNTPSAQIPPPQTSAPQTPAPQIPAPEPAAVAANGLPFPPPAPPPLELAAASTVAPPPAGAGTGPATEVQLAAMNSEQEAMHVWQRLQTTLPALFNARQPLVSKVQVDGHTFWRLRTGGFADIAAATRFCAAVRAGGDGCAIASF